MAKRGRPRGTGGPTHWSRNPANVAAHYASLLMELWLADAPMTEVTKLFSWSPEHQAIIEECWSKRGCERRYTVPKAIKLKLCELAIARVMELQRQTEDARPQIEASLQRSMSKPRPSLGRGVGPTKRSPLGSKSFPSARGNAAKRISRSRAVDKVFEIVTRRAPAVTLRRKARSPRR